ncbi:glycine cleavage system protein R [Shewanella intestini]|uniref:Glycine cleavage system transcriptional repressor n=1 Tax=Shewanella intestini TaxID=2017544 RepID=A0ABS5HZR3_9GAMM|nr:MULTISPECIES: ACT domain-containing protein [Shewanella]MBR9727242.1 glycine cleavage system transcriptional repressor [Shewanella intestini]MRG36044.1 glycine cleavage system transcriptional repressor [Shewanella sp. XMDDZSB0408]
MTNYMVVTAMGVDRPGLVGKISNLVSVCECDIVDSRMGLFGNEFTLIMMISGSWSSITQIETRLPSLSVELELMTVMKRTSKHTPQNYISRIEVSFYGEDQRGTMNTITQFLHERSLDLAAVRSHADEHNDKGIHTQTILLSINIPEKVDLATLENSIHDLANQLQLDCNIKRMQGIAAP